MSIFKTRKSKSFNYTPRFYNGEGNPFEIKHKFDAHRQTVGKQGGIKSKFKTALNDYKYNQNKAANRRVLLIFSILIVLFLVFIEFDLSLFFQ